ncbi:MAG: oligosaccharyl transferase, archaeosortase A system-associated [Dehalococcoidia bacterium]
MAVIVGIILAALCALSIYVRIYLPYDKIFVDGWVWFRETDAYYHMRNIEVLVNNFPHYNTFDPYILFPGGGGGLSRPFFDWIVAVVILLVGRGAPTQHTIEVVGAYMPAILGTLTLIPVYFIGKELFNRWVGIIAAILVIVLPTEFLHRSLLGFTDHHVAEVLFSTVSMLFLIMAIKRAREREISFHHILSRDWSTVARPLIYTLLAGIFFGLYLLSWWGGLMFVFITFAYFVVQFIVDHLRHKSTDYLCIVATPFYLVALLMLLPVLVKGMVGTMDRVSLLFAALAPIGLALISRIMARKALSPGLYPLTLLSLGLVILAALSGIAPSLLASMRGAFGIFTLTGGWLTILEAQAPTSSMLWWNYNTCFVFAIISLIMLVYLIVKEKSADKTLFVVWSVIMLIANLRQRRFGYYYAVNVALLSAYFSWKMLDIAGLRKLLGKPKEVVAAVKKFKKREKKDREKAKAKTFMQPRGAWISVIVVGILLFFFVVFPSVGLWRHEPTKVGGVYIGYTRSLAENPSLMDRDWYTSLLWLRDNSPEPFGRPEFYYDIYPPASEFEYPETAYGVLSWWDYGYYIMQVAHRIPNANPGQAGAVQAGKFFTAQNETAAQAVVEEYNLGTKYVMIDYQMATPSKFYAMARWAGQNESQFYDIFYVPADQQWTYLFYPAYYQSMVVRLYNFECKAVTPTECVVITYEEKIAVGGQRYKEITGGWSFPSYEDALAYIAAQPPGDYRIVGTNPFSSPVPLEKLETYEFVYPTEGSNSTTPVKIFRYLGSAGS